MKVAYKKTITKYLNGQEIGKFETTEYYNNKEIKTKPTKGSIRNEYDTILEIIAKQQEYNTEKQRLCKNCNQAFIPQRQGEFCSPTCYKAWWKREIYDKKEG